MSQRRLKARHDFPVPQKHPGPHIVVSVLCGVERHNWIAPQLSVALVAAAFSDYPRQFSYAPCFGIFPVSAARNKIVEEYFLSTDAEWLVMIDNDVVPPLNFLDFLKDAPPEADILIAPYFVWDPIEAQTMLCFGDWRDGKMITPEQHEVRRGYWEGGCGGTGFLAVRRHVIEEGKIEKPVFRIVCNDYEGQTMSEDIYFTSKAKEAGYRIFTNVDYLCSHFHTVDLKEVNAGICRKINSYVETVQTKYEDIGIDVDSLTRELHPELVKRTI